MTLAGALRTFSARLWACRETAFLTGFVCWSFCRRFWTQVSSGRVWRVRLRRSAREGGVGMGGSVADKERNFKAR